MEMNVIAATQLFLQKCCNYMPLIGNCCVVGILAE